MITMESTRQQKVNRLLQKDLSEILREMAVHFPGVMITVTSVRITSDLSLARVNLSLFAVSDKENALKMIKSKKNEIRHLLGLRIKNQLRVVPELQFFIDHTLDQMERIDELLKQ